MTSGPERWHSREATVCIGPNDQKKLVTSEKSQERGREQQWIKVAFRIGKTEWKVLGPAGFLVSTFTSLGSLWSFVCRFSPVPLEDAGKDTVDSLGLGLQRFVMLFVIIETEERAFRQKPWFVRGASLGLIGAQSACQYRRCGFSSWVGKIPWRREWQPAPVFLPGISHGQRSLVGCSWWGRK